MAVKQGMRGVLARARRVHFIGLGGSGMGPLASLLASHGKLIAGSDLAAAAVSAARARGWTARVGHHPDHLGSPDLVIVSAAIHADNPELVAARQRGLLVLTHAQALGELMDGSHGVAVAGTHGKTTTTALLGFLLEQVGLDPTVLVGAPVLNFGSGARSGRGPHLVVEADEYSRRFLELRPRLALITGIEPDHLDYFQDLDEIVATFRQFVAQLAPGGLLLTCADDPVLSSLDRLGPRVTYGQSRVADWRLDAFRARRGGGCDLVISGPAGQTTAQLQLSGRHNAVNAVGALAAAVLLGAPLDLAAAALSRFSGTERRFQTLGKAGGVWVIDDYAHHPTAVRATLEAAREVHPGRLWAVFQPHTTNRLSALFDDFAACFDAADRLTLLPVYLPPGRETGAASVSSADLLTAIQGTVAELSPSLAAAEELLAAEAQPGDLLLIMGAGDVTDLARAISLRFVSAGRVH